MLSGNTGHRELPTCKNDHFEVTQSSMKDSKAHTVDMYVHVCVFLAYVWIPLTPSCVVDGNGERETPLEPPALPTCQGERGVERGRKNVETREILFWLLRQ